MAYKQHFIEWFSGKSLPSYWTFSQDSGTGTGAMVDEVDGGYEIHITSTANFSRTGINFNNKRQYNHDGSVAIGVVKRVNANTQLEFGLVGNNVRTSLSYAIAIDDSLTTYKQLLTDDGSGDTTTASTTPISTEWTNNKIEIGTTNTVLTINGVLGVSTSTDKPTTKLQPMFLCESRIAGTSGSKSRIRYMECYNT
jgi:hypothetical protein